MPPSQFFDGLLTKLASRSYDFGVTMTLGFSRRWIECARAKQSPAVVGIDPRPQALPATLAPGRSMAARVLEFCRIVLPVIAKHVPAVKPNIAFFETHGADGLRAYEETCRIARELGLLVIGDVKRGDIGSTAEAYADYHFRLADALTVHPWLGSDALRPFFARCHDQGKALFVLVRTSNPSASEIQDLRCGDEVVYQRVARLVAQWGQPFELCQGYGPIGAVVGATRPAEIAALRALMPHAWFLLPGVGAQGGQAKDCAAAFDSDGLGGLISQSRGVMQAFAPEDPDWLERVEAAAAKFAAESLAVARTAVRAL